MIIMNAVWKLDGLIWSQLVADFLNAVIATAVFYRMERNCGGHEAGFPGGEKSF